MFEITCGALPGREPHKAGLKMKLLSPAAAQSRAHGLIVHPRHCYRCCSRHTNEWVDLWEPSSWWKVVCLLGNQLHLWSGAQTDSEQWKSRTGVSLQSLDRHSVLVWPLKSDISSSLTPSLCILPSLWPLYYYIACNTHTHSYSKTVVVIYLHSTEERVRFKM